MSFTLVVLCLECPYDCSDNVMNTVNIVATSYKTSLFNKHVITEQFIKIKIGERDRVVDIDLVRIFLSR